MRWLGWVWSSIHKEKKIFLCASIIFIYFYPLIFSDTKSIKFLLFANFVKKINDPTSATSPITLSSPRQFLNFLETRIIQKNKHLFNYQTQLFISLD